MNRVVVVVANCKMLKLVLRYESSRFRWSTLCTLLRNDISELLLQADRVIFAYDVPLRSGHMWAAATIVVRVMFGVI
jgi:hypothetical protein